MKLIGKELHPVEHPQESLKKLKMATISLIGLFLRGICSYSINMKRNGKELHPAERPQEIV